MKEIQLTQGKVALVDNEDYEWLNQWKWYAKKSNNNFYACRKDPMKEIIMHKLIIKGKMIDHRDGNSLNNQKHNLRLCTYSENGANRKVQKNKSFGVKYLGVYAMSMKRNNKIYLYFQAALTYKGKRIYIGIFKDETEAAKAYDKAALKYHGEFANLNII